MQNQNTFTHMNLLLNSNLNIVNLIFTVNSGINALTYQSFKKFHEEMSSIDSERYLNNYGVHILSMNIEYSLLIFFILSK